MQPLRQRFMLGTGKGLQSAPSKTPSPGFKKGGAVRSGSPSKTPKKTPA